MKESQEYQVGGVAQGLQPLPTAPHESEFIPTATALPLYYNTPTSLPVVVPSAPMVQAVAPQVMGPAAPQVMGPAAPHGYSGNSSPGTRYVYRDERSGVCVICGLSFLFFFVICCACLLPAILVPIFLISKAAESLNDEFGDVSWDDVYVAFDNSTAYDNLGN